MDEILLWVSGLGVGLRWVGGVGVLFCDILQCCPHLGSPELVYIGAVHDVTLLWVGWIRSAAWLTSEAWMVEAGPVAPWVHSVQAEIIVQARLISWDPKQRT